MNQFIRNSSFGLFSLALLSVSINAAGANGVPATPMTAPVTAAATTAANIKIKSSASHEVEKRRLALVKEVIVANDEIRHAIWYLEKKESRHAFKALEKADGQLNAALARDPNLKLAAIDVRANFLDFESDPDTIHKMVKEAKSSLDDGNVQVARQLLTPLVSEMHIDTDFLPLEIYPAAIKQASRQIQQSKFSEAVATLTDALSSIVTTEEIIPLPLIKAEGDVLEAEQLLKQDQVNNKADALSLLSAADRQLATADALGYGQFKDLHGEIGTIKTSVEGGEVKPGLFEKSKQLFHEIAHIRKG